MPLIIVTGHPCSGKTHRSLQLLHEFESRRGPSTSVSIVYLPSQHAALDPSVEGSGPYNAPDPSRNPRDSIYESAKLEKIARAEEFSAIRRAVHKNVVVIADAPNYIKGFRYQLYCEAKASGTRSVVVHTAAPEHDCRAWNNARLQAWNWPTADKAGHGLTETSTSAPPSKMGRDTYGNLQPESHTAIYGDSAGVPDGDTRSRSSSMGAAVSDDQEQDQRLRQRAADDNMTLKSLYISDDRGFPPDLRSNVPPGGSNEQAPLQQSSPQHPPPAEPPDPKSSLPYSPSAFRSLFMRYEPPSPFTRWDTPLFTIPNTDLHPPYDAIWNAIFPGPTNPASKKAIAREKDEQMRLQKELALVETKAHPTDTSSLSTIPVPIAASAKQEITPVRQNAATVLPTAAPPNALQLLETTTGEITKLVLAAFRSSSEPSDSSSTLTIVVPNGDGQEMVLELEKPDGMKIDQPRLQRLRRKYTQIQKGMIAHGQGFAAGMQGRRGVAEGFVRFIEAEWEGESGV